jgi:Domain of unknown function (DUF4390)
MPSWKKDMRSRTCLPAAINQLLACLVFLCMPINIQASTVTVEFATSTLVNERYHVDAYIEYDFDDEVLTALAHGITLQIDTYIRVKRERDWLWDPVVRDETISFLLERHALSDHYLLTNLNTDHKEQYQYLDEALRAMGSIKEHFLFDKSTIDPDASYIGFIMAELNIEALPPPLRPVAYISSQWQAESPWYEWLVK